MSYNPIELGNQPNDGLGDGGRTGGGKINAMFHAVFSASFIKDNKWNVTRFIYNAGNPDIISWRVDDKVSGWVDAGKNRYVEGIVLNASISLPADVDDPAKFFLIRDINKLT